MPKKKRSKAINKYSKYTPILFISISILLAVLVRLHYANLPFTDDWAEERAVATLKPMIEKEVEQQGGSEQMIDKELDEALGRYEEKIDEISEEYKESYRDPDGSVYLYGIDPYNYLSEAKNNPNENFLAFFTFNFHKFLNLFADVSLMQALFYVPVVFVSLTIIPLYFIARRITHDIGGLIASALFAIHPEFLKYSLAGLADTNTLNAFFIVLTTWMVIEMVFRKGIVRYILAGALLLSIMVFKFTWDGYLISVLLIIFYSIALVGIWFIYRVKLGNVHRLMIVSSILMIGIFVAIYGFNPILSHAPKKVQVYLGNTVSGVWPSSFESIKELGGQDAGKLIFGLGGTIFVGIVLLASFLVVWDIARKKEARAAFILLIGFLAFLLAGSKSIRFFPFAIPFASILFSMALIWLYNQRKLIDALSGGLKIASGVIVLLLIAVPVYASFGSNYHKVRAIRPRMDDSLYYATQDLGDSEDALVITWWDKGHFYRALSEPDVFLRASPTMPHTYWLARIYLSTDEQMAAGITRMLTCNGQSRVFSSISKKYSAEETIEIINEILVMHEEDAKKYLKDKGLSIKLTTSTHCDERDTYLVVTDDMFTKFHTVQKYAFWDVGDGEVKNLINDLDKDIAIQTIADKYDISKIKASVMYNDILKNQEYEPFKQYSCTKNNAYTCNIDGKRVYVDLDTKKLTWAPKRLIVIDGNTTTYNLESEDERTLFIYNRNGAHHAILVEPHIADSMYINMLFGFPLENFELISDHSKPETMRVVTHRLKWQ